MRSVKSENNIIVKILRNAVLILFIIICISVFYNSRNRDSTTVSALMAEASASQDFKGVFIRDEEVISYSGGGVLNYNVSDGGRVGNGTVIARVYPNDQQISTDREIARLERELEILNKIQNPGTVESAQPASLSENIEEYYRNYIYCRDTGDYETVEDDMDELLILLSTYQIVTDENVDFNQKIADITAELSRLRSSTIAPSETITSERSAYFVSYCDGYESVFTKEGIESLTIQQLNEVSDERVDSQTIVGKLIDNYEWYLAGVIDNSKKEYIIGDTVTLRFESMSEDFTAEVVDIRDEGDASQSIIVVSCEQYNYNLVQHRTDKVELIKGDYKGLKVPREAIRFLAVTETVEDEETGIKTEVTTNYKGVYIQEGEQVEFRKIDVIYEGSDYVLSAVHDDDSSYLSLYDDIMIEGVDSDGK